LDQDYLPSWTSSVYYTTPVKVSLVPVHLLGNALIRLRIIKLS